MKKKLLLLMLNRLEFSTNLFLWFGQYKKITTYHNHAIIKQNKPSLSNPASTTIKMLQLPVWCMFEIVYILRSSYYIISWWKGNHCFNMINDTRAVIKYYIPLWIVGQLQLTQTTYVIIKYSCPRYTLLDVMWQYAAWYA